jgi:hypothetical protein
VLGDDPQAAVRPVVLAVAGPRQLLGLADDGFEQVGLVHRVGVLEHHGDPLQAHAGVDVLLGQLADDVEVLVPDVLHEHQVPDLEVAVGLAGRAAVGAKGGAAVVVDLRARAAGAGHPHRPVVLLHAQALDALGGHADPAPQLEGLVVVQVDGGPEPVRLQPEPFGDQLPGIGDGAFLEVVAEGEVAQHLEEGAVAAVADVLDVGGAGALLHAGGPAVVGLDLAQEVGLELVHAGVGEQQGRVVGDQRAGGDQPVVALDEEVGEPATDGCGVHGVDLAFVGREHGVLQREPGASGR